MNVVKTLSNTVLIVLDGFGYREDTENNAIALANTPVWDKLWQNAPKTLIDASGGNVGLPSQQMGNSEVGHMHLGAGRLINQDLTRINAYFNDCVSDPEVDAQFDSMFASCQSKSGILHLMGLLSDGGVHSHVKHCKAIIQKAAKYGIKQIFVHAFLDGRDTPPKSALKGVEEVQKQLQDLEAGRVATVAGRFYAMDRDQRWERIEKAYDLLTYEGADVFNATSVTEAIELAYAREESDEFVKPTLINGGTKIQNNDTIMFFNFRSDRARQLTQAFVDPSFNGWSRKKMLDLVSFYSMTSYSEAFEGKVTAIFSPRSFVNTLGEWVSKHGKKQLRIAETEKYAHVTFFFNGGNEKIYPMEDRHLVPSPKVESYACKPEMSAYEVTDYLCAAIENKSYDMMICNFANGDMVGHTGDLSASIKAVEALDICLGKIVDAVIRSGMQCLITADHGNVEMMFDACSDQLHTAHTCNPVPLVYVGWRDIQLAEGGALYDVAPTVLSLMDLPLPTEMTGKSLVSQRVD